MPDARTRKAQETRARILEMALELFNANGAAAVTTNHIAEALKMSPGNLYYHFRNKEAIVRAILERMVSRMEAVWGRPEGAEQSLQSLEAVLAATYELLWAYRFFARELPMLLQADGELREAYGRVRELRLSQTTALLESCCAAGLLVPPPGPDGLQRLARGCWLIGEWWIPFLDVSGEELTPENLQEGIALMLRLLGVPSAATPLPPKGATP